MKRRKNALILLAGGTGSRMGAGVPKQFMELRGKPLIWYSLNAVQRSDLIDECILVSGKDQIRTAREITDRYGFDKVSHIVTGGAERYLSVVNAVLALMEKNGSCECAEGAPEIILIHDGARPFLTDEIIQRCLDGVEDTGGCAAAVPSKDTVKIADESGYVMQEPLRRNVWLMQTPQVFRSDILCRACRGILDGGVGESGHFADTSAITDDVCMVRMITGADVKLVMGDYENIKVTTPDDLIIADKILEAQIGHFT